MSSSRLKSQIWLHYTSANGEKKVKCLYCDQQLSIANKSTCSLIRHMNKKHPTQHIVRQAHPESNTNTTSHDSTNNIPTVTQSTESISTAVSVASSAPPRIGSTVSASQTLDGFFTTKL